MILSAFLNGWYQQQLYLILLIIWLIYSQQAEPNFYNRRGSVTEIFTGFIYYPMSTVERRVRTPRHVNLRTLQVSNTSPPLGSAHIHFNNSITPFFSLLSVQRRLRHIKSLAIRSLKSSEAILWNPLAVSVKFTLHDLENRDHGKNPKGGVVDQYLLKCVLWSKIYLTGDFLQMLIELLLYGYIFTLILYKEMLLHVLRHV